MSGNVNFNRGKFMTLADYLYARGIIDSTRLSWIMFHSDFGAYAKLGEAITGATWCKGEEVPFCREMGEDYFDRFIEARRPPWWIRLIGRALTLGLVVRMARP
jgi:hypothetical protein